jgi:UDP:flavonoid glycosyltransferase YjiC (YdhE family)
LLLFQTLLSQAEEIGAIDTPMHYGIFAIGSRGDVQPYVALALGLMEAGHRATVMAHQNFKDFVEGYGVEYYPLFGNTEKLLYSEEGRKILQSGDAITLLRYLRKAANNWQEKVNADIWSGSTKPDVLVTSVLGMAWVDAVSDRSGKKWAVVQLTFPTTPTSEFPFAGLDFFYFPAFNRFTYWLLRTVFWNLNRKHLNEFRRSLDLPPLKRSIYRKVDRSRIPNLYGISPALVPRPHDWGPEIDITGFIYLPGKYRIAHPMDLVPDDLQQWLDTGEKPIYIGFGSMPIPDPGLFTGVLNELLARSNHRFLFCQGWSTLPDLKEDPKLYTVKYINHDWLFPRCKAAVIHGGVGTLGAVLKACIPLVIVSIFGDQIWWGKFIDKKNIGAHLPFKKLNTIKLSAAIQLALSTERSNNIRAIGSEIRKEDGLGRAIDILKDYFEGA